MSASEPPPEAMALGEPVGPEDLEKRPTPLSVRVCEIIAALFGVACVYLAGIENMWTWPTGLIQVALYIYVFAKARLYSDMGLHVIYVGLSLWGWYNWAYGGGGGELPVTVLSNLGRVLWVAAALGATLLLGFVMSRYTKAALPYWDAATTVVSLAAQYLMTYKYLGCWVAWITVDVMAIFVYLRKKLYVTMVLYAIFLYLAVQGLQGWLVSYLAAG